MFEARKLRQVKTLQRRERTQANLGNAVKRAASKLLWCILAASLVSPTPPAQTSAQPVSLTKRGSDLHDAICHMIDEAAKANGLPIDFFTRLIWQESRLLPAAIGPLTSSGEHAEGIAQFMPGTAAERGLDQPFDPVEALPKSGAFLAELRDEFGNLGLAAAAYNAGPQRVRDYLAGSRDLPLETRNYVVAITGRPVEEWTDTSPTDPNTVTLAIGAPSDCRSLVALLPRTPDPLSTRWQGRSVPSWCKGLGHPDITVCGPVHLIATVIRSGRVASPRSHLHLMRSAVK